MHKFLLKVQIFSVAYYVKEARYEKESPICCAFNSSIRISFLY